jgi:hypothetical protein
MLTYDLHLVLPLEDVSPVGKLKCRKAGLVLGLVWAKRSHASSRDANSLIDVHY